jgi:hypothetical protein
MYILKVLFIVKCKAFRPLRHFFDSLNLLPICLICIFVFRCLATLMLQLFALHCTRSQNIINTRRVGFPISEVARQTQKPNTFCVYTYEVKAVPLQAWSGPEGSKKLRFPDFMTTAQDGGKVVSPTHRPHLPPGNTPGTRFC